MESRWNQWTPERAAIAALALTCAAVYGLWSAVIQMLLMGLGHPSTSEMIAAVHYAVGASITVAAIFVCIGLLRSTVVWFVGAAWSLFVGGFAIALHLSESVQPADPDSPFTTALWLSGTAWLGAPAGTRGLAYLWHYLPAGLSAGLAMALWLDRRALRRRHATRQSAAS